MASRSTIYPFLHFQAGVDWKDVKPELLSSLNRLGMQGGKVITITSGYRSVAEQTYLWDNAKKLGLVHGVTVAKPGTSDHNFGRAVDATVDGKPVGKVFSQQQFAKVGLKYLPRDTVHVTFLSSKEGGSSVPATDPSSATGQTAAPVDQSAGAYAPTPVVAPSSPAPPNALGTPGPDVQLPGSVDYTISPHHEVAGMWNQAAQGDLVSPDTLNMLRNAQLSAGV